MPWQPREIIQFCLLLLCVPMQYYSSGIFDYVKEKDRSQVLINTVKGIEDFKNRLLDVDLWSYSLRHWTSLFTTDVNLEASEEDEPTEEVPVDDERGQEFDLLKNLAKVHAIRPSNLFYRIGQVVQLTELAFRGVIVSWQVNSEDTIQPVYTILVDESHLKKGMRSLAIEVEQDKLFVIKDREVKHVNLKWYFTSFDGSQYLPRDWLRKIYPKD